MGNLTKNLSRYEFACKCACGFNTVDIELAPAIQDTADHFAEEDGIRVRIKISGPNRCVKHNENEGGAKNSQHIYGRAADYKLFNRDTGEQIDPDRVADYLDSKYPDQYGIGRYSNRTHFDTRSNGPARWDVRT
jgi:uncharacterized protein YcbK (DUF882 family)